MTILPQDVLTVHHHAFEGTRISHVENVLHLILRRHTDEWYTNVLLWCGLAGWLGTWVSWLSKGFSYDFYFKAFFVLSLDLVCLQLYLEFDMLGVYIGVFLSTAQSVALQYATWRSVDISKLEDFDAGSVFTDVAGPLGQTLVVGAAQAILITFYMMGLCNTLETGTYTLTFWMAGYFIQMAAIFNRGAASMLGGAFETPAWITLLRHSGQIKWTTKGFDGKFMPEFVVPKPVLLLRGAIAFIVNNIFREVMSFSLPIRVMMLPEPYLVVATCVGVSYLTKIDDMPNRKYKLSIAADDRELLIASGA